MKKEKRILDNDIKKALNDFEERTGVKVTGPIYFKRVTEMGGKGYVVDVVIEVAL